MMSINNITFEEFIEDTIKEKLPITYKKILRERKLKNICND